MKLSEVISNFQGYIPPEDYILVEYELFFNDNLGKYNRFSIDDNEQIEILKEIMNNILSTDKNAILYVCADGYELIDNLGINFIYADSIWINTTVDISFINHLFDDAKIVQPSAILDLSEMEETNQSHIYCFQNDGTIIDLTESDYNKQLDNIIVLYWD